MASGSVNKPPVPKRKPRLDPENQEKSSSRISFALIAKIKTLFKQTINEYRNELDSLMNDDFDDSISEIELVENNEIVVGQLIKDFKKGCGIYDDQLLNDNFITKLKNETNEMFEEFKVRFFNRGDKESPIDQSEIQPANESDEIKQIHLKYLPIYENKLKQSIIYPINWTEMKKRHLEVRSLMIGQFVVKERGSSVLAFSNWLDTCFNDFKIKNTIQLEEMDNFIRKLTSDYIEGMGKHFQNQKTFYENEKLNQLHKEEMDKVLAKLEQFDNDAISETNEFRKKVVIAINKEFDRYSIQNKFSQSEFKKELDEKVQALIKIYEDRILALTNELVSPDKLSEENESLKKQLLAKFKETNTGLSSDRLDYYLKDLDEKMNNSYEDCEKLLIISYENRKLEEQRIVTQIREKYKQNMKMKFEIRPFYLIRSLNDLHETFVEDLAQNYNYTITTINELINDIFSEFEGLNARNTPNEPAIGIDLGTTNSCVAYFIPGLDKRKSTVVIHNEKGEDITPSVVSFRPKNEIEIGNKAKDERDVWPENTVYSVKRLIGQTYTELDKINNKKQFFDNFDYKIINLENKPKICVKVDKNEKQFSPEEISAMILKKLKLIAEKTYLHGFDVKKAVITVPAYFSSAQKEATKQAGLDAGLEVLSIINEPTAAAIAYKADLDSIQCERNILIYDFGGGTFDLAVVCMEKGEIIIKAVNGDNYLGGDDIDNNLINYCIKVFLSETGLNLPKKVLKYQINLLRKHCEDCKIKLSKVGETNVKIMNFYEGFDLNVSLTRHKFEEINMAIFKRSIDLVEQTLKEIKMNYSEIDDIVLVGGTTRIPKIRQMLAKIFKKQELIETKDADLSVAIGAAIHAATLNGQIAQQNLFKFTDVTAMSLGLENAYKEIVKLIPRNALLPTRKDKIFQTAKDNQTSVVFCIYEGEDRMAENNNMIGNFELQNIPRGKKGQFEINVTFEINAEGILKVSAKCDQVESMLEIKKHNILYNDEEVERLLLNRGSLPDKIKYAGTSSDKKNTETENEARKTVLTRR